MPDLLLGLIGDNIATSRAPLLHRLAGRLCGLDVRYDRLVPRQLESDFDGVFGQAREAGYRGLNITYPYKEQAAGRVAIPDPMVRAMGAVNTVLFGPDGPEGHNTDHSGFVAAMRAAFPRGVPGPVCLIGAGGAGKAVAFGLLALAVREVRLVDIDRAKADAVAAALTAARPEASVSVHDDAVAAARGAAGLINCTPVGMIGHAGTPLPRSAMRGADWAFDAVYTPIETEFMVDAAAAGLTAVSGCELFFHQGVDAWRLFSGRAVDAAALRAALAAEPAPA